jgi:hypothetical protein
VIDGLLADGNKSLSDATVSGRRDH